MSHRVRIKVGHKGIQLPNGFAYDAGAEVTLTDDEFEDLSAQALTDLVDDITPVVGGAPAGVAIVRAFPFAFDTPDLLTGAAVYTPTIGDVLLDAWVEIVEPWDGTTPKGDFGRFTGGITRGFFYVVWTSLDMSSVDDTTSLQGMSAQNGNALKTSGLVLASALSAVVNQPAGPRYVPAKFTTADPIKVVVSADGGTAGDDPGATQGSAILYLVTATPA